MNDSAKKIGDYSLLGRLGAGGMSEVYLAEKSSPLGFRKRFALKVLRPERASDEERVASFIDEARIVAQLEHRNVAQVYDFGFEDDSPFLAMEYVPGVTLRRLVRDYGRLPARAALEILHDVAQALDAAHTARDIETGEPLGVVHRDVCPTNVMVSESLEVKLLDFGIAMVVDRLTPNTLTGTIKGKPGYMSPEQMKGLEVDGRSDIFSLWVVFVELVLGRPLYQRATLSETLNAHVSGELPRLSNVDRDFPPTIEFGVERGLARDRNDRFSTAREVVEFARDLLEQVPGAGISAVQHVVQRRSVAMDTPTYATVETELTERPEKRRRASLWSRFLGGLLVGSAVLGLLWLLIFRRL